MCGSLVLHGVAIRHGRFSGGYFNGHKTVVLDEVPIGGKSGRKAAFEILEHAYRDRFGLNSRYLPDFTRRRIVGRMR
jgi:hypothetical protein